MSTKSFTDPFSKYKFTYTTSGNNATITVIDNTSVTDKTMLTIPPKIGTFTVVNVTAQIPVAVKKLTLCSGLSNPGNSTNCTFTDVTITPGATNTTNTTITNYQALKLASGCNLTINSGIISLGGSAFKNLTNFKGILTIPSGLTINASAFTGCAFTSVIITRGTNTTIGNYYRAIQIASGCNLTINPGITSISNTAFTAFTGTLTIPSGLTTINATAFTGCAFTSVIITKGITTVIGDYRQIKVGINCSLTIDDKITEIGDNAFIGLGFSGVLTIPKNVKKIGANAFKGCNGISGLQIDSNVITSIGESAFEGCTNFSGNLIIPTSVNYIGLNAFKSCVNLKENLSIPSGITFGPTNVGGPIISGCKFTSVKITKGTSTVITSAYNKLKDGLDTDIKYSLYIHDNITDILDNAFTEWTGLEEINFGENSSLKTIGNSAFKGCTNLTSNLTIPKTVIKIGPMAFWLCTNLTGTLTMTSGINIEPSSMISSANSPFAGCKFTSVVIRPGQNKTINGSYSNLQYGLDTGSTLTIEEGITEINSGSFQNCMNFNCNLIIPSTVTRIGDNAFKGCNRLLGDLNIPDSVKTIGATAFEGFSNALNLPTSLSIDIKSFTVCKFKSIEIRGTTPFLSVIPQPILANDAALTINEGVTEIGPNVFNNCLNFTGTLTIPSTVTKIGDNAFKGCTGLLGLIFAHAGSNIRQRLLKNAGFSQLKTIGANAFYNCSGFISDLTIPPGVTTINDSAFYGCTKLTGTLTIPTSITTTFPNSFSFCKFNSVVITPVVVAPDVPIKINTNLNLKTGLLNASLTIPSGITEICNYAFNDCSSFKGILTIPSGVTMYANTFTYCNFTSVIITPGTDTKINSTYVYLNTAIDVGATLQIQDGITEISDSAFKQFTKLTGPLTIPSTVTTIGNYAFLDCPFADNLTIPHSVTSIGNYVFSDFKGILTIPPSVNFGNSPFNSCKFTSVVITKTPASTPQSINNTYDCLNLGVFSASLTINDGIILCNSAFKDGTNFKGTLTLPSDLKTIDTSAFSNCGFTGTLTIPSGVTTLGDNAFTNCTGFTGTLTIPSGVTTLGDNAFKNCTGFTGDVTVPSGVSQIDDVFSGTNFRNIYVYSTTNCNPYVFPDGKLKYLYPDNQLIPGTLNGTELTIVLGSTSGTTDYSNLTKVIIQKGTETVIGQQYNKLAAKLAQNASLEIQDGITEIETGTFTSCANFTNELIISSSVKKIASSVFSGTSFKKITIQGNNTNAIKFLDIINVYASSSIPNTYTSITLQK
jgi:hypothetical protein